MKLYDKNKMIVGILRNLEYAKQNKKQDMSVETHKTYFIHPDNEVRNWTKLSDSDKITIARESLTYANH